MSNQKWKITLKTNVGGSNGWKKGESILMENPSSNSSSAPSPSDIQKSLNEQLSGEVKNTSIGHHMWDAEKA